VPPLRVLFVDENIGGHRTMHEHLAHAVVDHPEIEATFVHVPRPGTARRVVGARVPGLARLDLDLQPLRAQLAAAWQARRLVRDHVRRADVVHWYTHNAALFAGDLVRSRPSVVSLDMTNAQNNLRLPHRLPTRFSPRVGRVAVQLERRVYNAATAVLTKSEWAARSVRDDYGVPADKTHVHPFGIVAGPPPVRRVPERPMLVFVGTTLARKGGEQLLRLWRAELRDRCDLTLVTREHVPPEPGLTVRNDIGIGNTDLIDVLTSSTLFVHPSEMDSSPHVVFEAMAAGLPVIVSTAGGMPEQVREGETGLLVRPADDRALFGAITALLDEPERALALGRAGRAALESEFSMDVTLPKLIAHLEDATRTWRLNS
jgi:glycosyltransferase involved in cell wall biosynthesis